MFSSTTFPNYFYKNPGKFNINTLFEPFRKINMLFINDMNIEENIAYLTNTKDLELSINTIDFEIWNLNRLEYAINSEHFENRVRDINLTLKNSDFITDTIISNINAIIIEVSNWTRLLNFESNAKSLNRK